MTVKLEFLTKHLITSREILSPFNFTVGENIIATTKIRNNYGAIQTFIFPIFR